MHKRCRRRQQNCESYHSSKCSANPITVTPIWKREFANGLHPIRGLYRTFFEKFLFKFPFSHKRFQMGQKIYLYQLYKLQRKSSTNPISVCKWEISPLPLQRILGFISLGLYPSKSLRLCSATC